jgi:hypothetical protein
VRNRGGVERWEIGVPCPDCGEPVLVEVSAWPDGGRAADCPEACAYDHLLTEAQREALAQHALDLLSEELESDDAEEE